MSGLTDIALAVVLGGGLGLGLWSIASSLPSWRVAPLTTRIAPYVRDVTDPAGTSLPDRLTDPTVAVARGVRALWIRAQARFARLAGGSESMELRLAQAGRPADAAAFRGSQLVWAIVGAGAGALLLVVAIAAGRFTAPVVALPAIGFIGGLVIADVALTTQAKSRIARIEEELPTVLEFLALCLAAGEGILSSVRRVAGVGSGELTAELRAVTIEVDTGATLTDALIGMTRRLRAPVLTRAIDHTVAAIERGSPLAETLQAQAADARDDAKRRLIETAGRKEIYMMIPLVFGLLPLSVLFAIFPGISLLQTGF
ncbi:MAG TPA: type II secretion system F family protein [Microbacterium sp.]|nr:type II secretion system F family protein [Microbacterium sp.]